MNDIHHTGPAPALNPAMQAALDAIGDLLQPLTPAARNKVLQPLIHAEIERANQAAEIQSSKPEPPSRERFYLDIELADNEFKESMGHKDLNDEQKTRMLHAIELGRELKYLCDTAADMKTTDHFWASKARTHFQEGLMDIKRAIANPDTF